ncbi:hypothetical protein [Halorubrum ezzemoulense]|uniref:hypothetical protein n=1 Tax=Halorubrum ezzemoulense TaxID=337243 RepID=UPI00111C7502|nr:hypothetical protein [Halorubrum ezzemoulense]
MSKKESSSDPGPRSVDLASFIEDHSALLLVMGAFAALALYISQFAPEFGTGTNTGLIYTTGFVSALGMAILSLLLVYKQLATEIGSWHNLHLAHYRLDNLPLAFFTLFNIMLILSISYLVTRFEPVIFMLVLVTALFAGYGIVLRLIFKIGKILPRSPWFRIPAIFIVSLVSALGSHFAVVEYFSGLEVSTIHELSLSEPSPIAIAVLYLLIVTIRTAAAVGVIASILSVPVVAYDKLRGQSPYDSPD